MATTTKNSAGTTTTRARPATKPRIITAPPNRLRHLRDARKLTQIAVGAAVGVSEQAIARWEKRLSRIPWAKQRLLAELFETTTDGLFREAPPVRRVPLVHVAETGAWFDPAAIDDETLEWIPIERLPEFDSVDMQAVRLADDSLSRRSLGAGSIAFFIPFYEERDRTVRNGALYAVLRQRADDGLQECVVRVAMEAADQSRWFAPDSTLPVYQAIPQIGDAAETIIVLGRVVYTHGRP